MFNLFTPFDEQRIVGYDPRYRYDTQEVDPYFPSTVAPWASRLPSTAVSNINTKMSSILSADLVDKGTEYEVHCDLPGVSKADLEVTITDGCLNIRGMRHQVHEDDTEFTHKIERTYGKVQRSIRLPRNADEAKAVAKFEGGVLMITFPKLAGVDSGIKQLAVK